ncbi:MAG: metallo-mystery pair system four-Cys motif protein [bacterium]|nr:metallo-mystery pair system four-Cys motif protein [bacterium]
MFYSIFARARRALIFAMLPAFALVFLNCSQLGLESEEDDSDTNLLLLSAAAILNTPVTLNFSVVSGTQTVQCGSTFTVNKAVNGSTTRTFNPEDLRFYISNIRMIGADGVSELPVSFGNDGVWQYNGAALLDFEDATGNCSGSTDTNTRISGTTVAGGYSGVVFDLGLPESLNQLSNSTAPSPLNLNQMYWSWSIGYKFTKIEFTDTGSTRLVRSHFGSLNCGGDISSNTCANPYRSSVRVTSTSGFDPTTNAIALDINELTNGFDSTGGANLSCMPLKAPPAGAPAGDEVTECPKLLTQMGLDSSGNATGTQSAFAIR